MSVLLSAGVERKSAGQVSDKADWARISANPLDFLEERTVVMGRDWSIPNSARDEKLQDRMVANKRRMRYSPNSKHPPT
jgi:hypothetical protein